jgi:hypothetical protein
MMDDHGDLIANQRSAQQPYHRESRETYRAPFDGKLDADAAALVRAFIARCRARGITVIAGFPAFLDFPEYASGSYAAFFDSVARLYEQQDVPLLGMPSDFFLPRESFFDSNYHLHDEAAAELTARIAPRLSRALGCAADDGGAAKCVDPWPPLDFTRPGVPLGVQALSGFSIVEPWGRWTDGVQANIRFAQPLPRRFRLDLAVEHVFHPTGSLAIEVSLGGERRRVLARPGERLNVEFDNPSRLREIGLRLPDGGSPRSLGVSNDDRHLGVGLSSGRVIPID